MNPCGLIVTAFIAMKQNSLQAKTMMTSAPSVFCSTVCCQFNTSILHVARISQVLIDLVARLIDSFMKMTMTSAPRCFEALCAFNSTHHFNMSIQQMAWIGQVLVDSVARLMD